MICAAICLVLTLIVSWLVYEARHAPLIVDELTYTRVVLADDENKEVKDDNRPDA